MPTSLQLLLLSRFKEALPILKEALSFSFDNPAVEQQVHFSLGVCLEETNDKEAAKQELTRALGFGLKNDVGEQTLYRLALLHYKAGALAQAKHHLETILRDYPTPNATVPRCYVYESLSQTCRYLGDDANAKLYKDFARKAR